MDYGYYVSLRQKFSHEVCKSNTDVTAYVEKLDFFIVPTRLTCRLNNCSIVNYENEISYDRRMTGRTRLQSIVWS